MVAVINSTEIIERFMAVSKQYQRDVALILSKRHENGEDYWATPDGRWGVGSPFATLDCILMLHELGMPRSDPILKEAAKRILHMAMEDGRFRPVPNGAVYPCHTANAARALCRLGYAKDRRLKRTFDHLFGIQHDDGGWRCNTVKLGRSAVTSSRQAFNSPISRWRPTNTPPARLSRG